MQLILVFLKNFSKNIGFYRIKYYLLKIPDNKLGLLKF